MATRAISAGNTLSSFQGKSVHADPSGVAPTVVRFSSHGLIATQRGARSKFTEALDPATGFETTVMCGKPLQAFR